MGGWLNQLGSSIAGAARRWMGPRDHAHASEGVRKLAEGSLQGMLVHDGQRRLFANQAFADMHGYPDVAAVIAASETGQHISPEDRAAVRAEWQRILAGRQTWSRRRLRRLRLDGSVLWVDVVLGPIIWEGRPAIQGIQIDVTREVEAEARFRTLLEESLQGIAIHDGTQHLFVNAAFARMHGYPDVAAALGAAGFSADFFDDDRQQLAEQWRGILEGRLGWSRERVRRRRADGGTLWVDLMRGPITWEGRPAIQVISVDVTREVEAATELRRNEARFRAVIDNLPQILTVKDADRRFQIVNRAFERWYGISAAHAIGRTPEELYDRPVLAALIKSGIRTDEADVLATGRTVTRESRRPDAAGDVCDIIMTKFAVRTLDGDIEGVGTIVTDVTPLKQAQTELVRREAELRRNQDTLVRVVRQGLLAGGTPQEILNAIVQLACATLELRRVSVWTSGEPFTRAARVCAAAWDDRLKRHLTPGETVALAPSDLASWFAVDYFGRLQHDLIFAIEDVDTDPQLTEAGRAHFRASGIGARLAALIRLPDQTVGVVTFLAGQPRRWTAEDQAFARSIADLMAFAFLSERHREALAALDLVGQGLYVESALGTVIYANRLARRLAGVADDAAAVTLDRLPALPRARTGDVTDDVTGEITWRTPANETFELAVARTALPGAGAVTVIADITERKLREHERRALEAEMRQAAKLEAVGRLAGGIAHDFNNLLGTILGFASFLQEDLPADSAQHSYAARIAKASEHAKEVVKQLLAFTRATDVERRITDLGSLVGDSVDLLRAALPSSVDFVVDTGSDPLPALVNNSQIHQILLNLCINANDALDGQPGTIRLGLARLAAGGLVLPEPSDGVALAISGHPRPDWAYARLTVADDGAGMDAATLARVFDPFFTTKRPGHGTGLGLAVVHGIVAAYDGISVVESRLGSGTRFTVYLPLAETGAADVGAAQQPVRPRGSETVLVVDDEPDLLEMMRIGLTRLGYSVTGYSDPARALAAFRRDPDRWDVVVTDQVMPGLNGGALIAKLREIRPRCPIILCTGFSDGATERLASEAGVAGFFLKPVEPYRIAETIRALRDG